MYLRELLRYTTSSIFLIHFTITHYSCNYFYLISYINCIFFKIFFYVDVDECERQHKERQPAVDHQCGPNAVSCRPTGATTATAECVCRRGWTTAMATVAMKENGTLTTAPLGCTVNVDDCAGPDVKCSNGGTCLDLIGGYACACLPGYTGQYILHKNSHLLPFQLKNDST